MSYTTPELQELDVAFRAAGEKLRAEYETWPAPTAISARQAALTDEQRAKAHALHAAQTEISLEMHRLRAAAKETAP